MTISEVKPGPSSEPASLRGGAPPPQTESKPGPARDQIAAMAVPASTDTFVSYVRRSAEVVSNLFNPTTWAPLLSRIPSSPLFPVMSSPTILSTPLTAASPTTGYVPREGEVSLRRYEAGADISLISSITGRLFDIIVDRKRTNSQPFGVNEVTLAIRDTRLPDSFYINNEVPVPERALAPQEELAANGIRVTARYTPEGMLTGYFIDFYNPAAHRRFGITDPDGQVEIIPR